MDEQAAGEHAAAHASDHVDGRAAGRASLQWLTNLVLIAVFLGLGLWAGPHVRSAYERLFPAPAFVTGDFTALYQQAAKPVVLFSTSTCPYCARTREMLRREGVDYQDYVVDQSPEAKRRFEAFGGGGVPQLFVGARHITGFREDVIRDSLALARR